MAKPRSKFKKVKWLFGKEIEIPEEWEIHTVESVSKRIVSGGTPSTTMLEYWNGNIPWTRSSVLLDPYLKSGEKFITAEGLRNSSSVLIPKNNLLVSSRVSVGNISISAIDVAISQDVTGIIINKAYARSEFLYWYLKQHIKKLVLISQGTTIQGFTRKELAKLLVFLPSLSEQQKIASIFSGVDALIESTQKVIEKTERLKKGLMQELMTRGIGHTKFKKVKWLFGKELEIPVGWEISKFHSKIHMEYGSSLTEEQRDNHGKPVYGSGGIIGFHSKPIVQGPALLVARKGSLGNTFYETNYFFPIDTVYYITKNKTGFNLRFLFYYIKNMKLENYAIITSKPGISRSEIYSLSVLFPSLSEQTKIASILSGVDAYIQKNQEYKKKMELLKKGLMQKLLTGQIRVKVDH